ncbi:MAG: terminase, partial [Hyphomicrobiaceae bacterium]
MSLLDDMLGRLKGLAPEQIAQIDAEIAVSTAKLPWVPNPGPQTLAYFSPADILLYGGQGGGGKSQVLLGLAFTKHRRSLILRRRYTDLGALIEEALKINGGRAGFNGSPPPKLRTRDGRLIEFGACHHAGDEQHWQGQPHDGLFFDEAVQFGEAQVRFLLGWVRTAEKGQRTRTVLASNPPVSTTGEWAIGMFRPWLDLTHTNPAKPGELRWFVTGPDGKDLETDGPEPKDIEGKIYRPLSRTFIPASVDDNPFLVRTGYKAQLDTLQEPWRSAVRDG